MSRIARLASAVLVAASAFGLAGPAMADEALNAACQALGAEYGIEITLGSGATANLCQFEDNRACTLEAAQAGNCPSGGRKTTGYATEAARYCAWLGGEVNMVESSVWGMEEIDGTCTLPDGTDCLVGRLYYGTCD